MTDRRIDPRIATPRLLDFESRDLGLPIHDIKVKESLMKKINDSIEECLGSSALSYGVRTESMFAYVTEALGKIALIKQEDGGSYFSTTQSICIPDYRVLLESGLELLIEVKNCHGSHIETKISGYIEYANLMGKDLYIAVYWSQYKLWALVKPSDFLVAENGKGRISYIDALMKNHMYLLGDMHISVAPPLAVTIVAKEPFQLSSSGYDSSFEIADVYMTSEGKRLSSHEANLAFFLAICGESDEHLSFIAHGEGFGTGLCFEYHPVEGSGNDQIVGILSTMLSIAFDSVTTDKQLISYYTPDKRLINVGKIISSWTDGGNLKLLRMVARPHSNDAEC